MLCRVPSAEFVAVGILPEHSLGFGGYSHQWRGAAATIFTSVDDHVWGVVWKVNSVDSKHLDQQEHEYHRLIGDQILLITSRPIAQRRTNFIHHYSVDPVSR